MWDVLKGKISHSLEPLPRPLTGQEEENVKGENEDDVPQVYTDLFMSESRAALVGVTYDHNILFYDLVNFKKEKQVRLCLCICTCVFTFFSVGYKVNSHWEICIERKSRA